MKSVLIPPAAPAAAGLLQRVERPKWYGDFSRADLVLMGDPDCHAYIVRYKSERRSIYGNVYCWTLTMPRAGHNRYRGWADSQPEAKRQVELAIKENWR